MKWLAIIVFSSILSVSVIGQDERKVNDYVNLINNELKRISKFRTAKDASEYRPYNRDRVHDYGEFDYIVIGAGSAGSVVASRLSEIPTNNVLLLEAGDYESNFTDIPAYSFYLINTEYTWDFKTTPQTTACQGMVNRQCAYNRGRGVGGSSIVNTLNYIRGNRRDYDDWEAMGNPGWSFEDVLPFFKKSEDVHFDADPTYHGIGGELTVEYENPNGRQYEAFIEANLERRRHIIDHNAGRQIGVGKTQFNTNKGMRESAAKAFLEPARHRENLVILPKSYVIKININSDTKKAYGVTFSNSKKLYMARIRQEIILSAGTFQSAQILMLSGVGLPEDLRPHGIEVIHPLHVGHNLQDHPGYLGMIFESNATVKTYSLREYVKEYLKGYGPLPFAVTAKAMSWFQTRLERVPDFPDIEVIMTTSNNTSDIVHRFNNYNDETYNAIFRDVDPTRSFTLSLLQMRPRSRGRVRLASADPYAYPLLDLNFFSDPDDYDMRTMFEGIQIILDLVLRTNAFKHINANLRFAPHPRCRKLKYRSRKYWYCMIRMLTFPFFHPVGTCKMGPSTQEGAVVNHRLQVHGIGNLRVADCSIMPTIVTGHTNAPAIMIGEKAADMILNDHEY